MNATNDALHSFPVVVKEPTPTYPKKRWSSRKIKDQNKPATRQVTKGCHNCSHRLSKFYYWKESPCDNCLRSPAYYHYYFPPNNLSDKWEQKYINSTSGRNSLY